MHLAVNKLKIRLISGHMTVICHQSSPKSALELYHKHCAIFTNSIKWTPFIKRTLRKVLKVSA